MTSFFSAVTMAFSTGGAGAAGGWIHERGVDQLLEQVWLSLDEIL